MLRSRELRDLSEAKSLSNQPNKHLSKRSLQRSRARGRKRNKLDEELLDPGTVHDAASGWHHRDNKLDEVNERVGQQAHILAEEIWRERHGYMRDGIRSRARDEYEAKLAVQASDLKVEHAANLEEVRAMHAAQLKVDSNALAAARRALCAAQLECMREREAAEAARAALATAEVAAREERAAAATLELAHQHRDAQHERERAESRTVSTIDTTLAAAAASASSEDDAEEARLRVSAAALRRQREIDAAVAHEVELELAQQCYDAQREREREAESRTASMIDTAAPMAAAASASSDGDAEAARLCASAAALRHRDTTDKMCARPAHQPAHRDVIVSHVVKGMDTFSVPTGACVFNLIEMISWRWGVHVSTLRLREAASVERMDYYKPGERPLARHVMVKDELVTVHHGHYYEAVHLAGTAAAANLGAAMAKADLSGNEWVTHLYGDAPSDRKAWTSEVSAADVKWLCSQPELWKDARAMMKAARSRGIFRDKTAWSAFIEQKLKDDIVWKLLKKEGYLEVHRKLRKTSTAGTRFSQAAATKFTITRAKTDEQKRSRPVYDYERRIKRKMEAHGMTRADAVAADRVNFGAPPKAKLPKAKKKKKKTSTKKSKKKKKKSKKKSKKRKGAPAPTAATAATAAASAATAAGASLKSFSRKRSRYSGSR